MDEFPAEYDFTVGAEAEHFDFGLFVSNVVSDPERAARLYVDRSEAPPEQLKD
jgi:hypothetical protein